jgi:CheY-like chemotaxis protein
MRQSLDDPCVKVVLEAVDGYVMILNEHRQILAANQELLDALGRDGSGCGIGLRPGEALNCIHFTEGTDGCGTSQHCRTCGAVLAILVAQSSELPGEGECRLSRLRNDKLEAVDFRVRATPLTIKGNRLTAFVLHDISAKKRRDVLEQTFFHDFLNTLGGIVGWSQMMREADPQTAASEIAALAESLKDEIVSQRNLLAAERGELVVNWQQVDVRELVTKIQLVFNRHPTSHGKVLSISSLPTRTLVVSDPVLLLRVLVNALKNAFDATEDGGSVQFWFEWRGDVPVFVIGNAGVMPEYVQARLFERSFSTRSQEGRGIGTYSMKLLGERYLGGKVSFTSDEESATRFFISLAAQESSDHVQAASTSVHEPETASVISVLFVDDNEALLRFGEMLLTRLGYRTTPCRSGAEALAAFLASPDSFDVVITDWTMPKMSGEELVRRLSAIRPDIPILVCTGMGEAAMPNPAPANIRGTIGKPFTFQDLAESVGRVARGARS